MILLVSCIQVITILCPTEGAIVSKRDNSGALGGFGMARKHTSWPMPHYSSFRGGKKNTLYVKFLFEIKCFSNMTPLVMNLISFTFVPGFTGFTHTIHHSHPVIHKTKKGTVTEGKSNWM